MGVDVEEIVIGEDMFDEDDGQPVAMGEADPLSELLGSKVYVSDYVVDDCFQKFPDGTWVEPEVFDRFYFEHGLLIDIVTDEDEAEQAQTAVSKHYSFKTKWCADNDQAYVLLRWQDVTDPAQRLEVLAACSVDPVDIVLEPPAPEGLERLTPAPVAPGVEVSGEDAARIAEIAELRAKLAALEGGALAEPVEVEGDPRDPAPGAVPNPLDGVDLRAEGFEISTESLGEDAVLDEFRGRFGRDPSDPELAEIRARLEVDPAVERVAAEVERATAAKAPKAAPKAKAAAKPKATGAAANRRTVGRGGAPRTRAPKK